MSDTAIWIVGFAIGIVGTKLFLDVLAAIIDMTR